MERKGISFMKKMKIGIYGMIMSVSLILGACNAYAAGETAESSPDVREAAEDMMESLKTLDLEWFNERTDNYVTTYYNWIGIPVEKEYRVFNDLQQPGFKVGKWKKRYEFHHDLTEKMMENLTWKIEDVREDGDRAEVTMEITNLNMTDVMGEYEIYIWENMINSTGTGIVQMVKDLSHIADEESGLLMIIESCDAEDICTIPVTVTAYREDGAWKFHLDDEFINAFMGNLNAEEYSEDIQQRIETLEREYEEKLIEWEEQFADKMERWEDRFVDE